MLRPTHSWLFIPGASEKMLAKAPAVAADAVILDLEDSVAPDQKDDARSMVAVAVRNGGIASSTFVRINPLEGGLGREDLAQVVAPGLRGIMLPKAELPSQLEVLDAALTTAEARTGLEAGSILVAALVETPLGVLNAPALARGPRVCALCLGGEDLSLMLGARRTLGGHELEFARAMLVTAAAAGGAVAIDTVWTDIRDLEGLEMECRRVRDQGFRGKLAIHPGQLDTIHAAFAPNPDEVVVAQRIVEAYDGSNAGVAIVDGKMIDAPVVERARRLLVAAEVAAEREERMTRST